MNMRFYIALVRYAVVAGAAMMVFVAHHEASRSAWHMRDLARVASVLPNVTQQRAQLILRAAASRSYNYLMQMLAGHVYSSRTVPVTRMRVWDGLAAALAVFLVYRVATMCCNRATGIVSALLFASLPPSTWGYHALTMACALFNIETLLHALRRNSVPRWVLYCVSTLLLMACGVYAELFILQTWLAAILLMWLAWFTLTRWLPSAEEDEASARRRRRRAHYGLYFRGDMGVARFAMTMVGVALVTFFLVGVVLVFFTRFALTPGLVVQFFLWGCGLTVAVGLILLFMPLYSRERTIIFERLLSTQVTYSTPTPEAVFHRVHVTTLANLILAYAAAAVLFLPVLYVVHPGLNVFVRWWDGDTLLLTLRGLGLVRGVCFAALPFAWLGGTLALYRAGVASGARCVGATCILILSSLYLLQQRYAAMAAPFYVIGAAGLLVLLGEVVIYVWQRARKQWHLVADKSRVTTAA